MADGDISITISNLQPLTKFFATAPQRVAAELTRARNMAAIIVERLAKQEVPVDQGILRSSIRTTFRQFGLTVEPHSKYALAVHEGTKPHWPPIQAFTGKEEALDKWARRHGVPAWAVAQSIATKGTKANPFMSRAATSAKPDVMTVFDKAVTRIVEG